MTQSSPSWSWKCLACVGGAGKRNGRGESVKRAKRVWENAQREGRKRREEALLPFPSCSPRFARASNSSSFFPFLTCATHARHFSHQMVLNIKLLWICFLFFFQDKSISFVINFFDGDKLTERNTHLTTEFFHCSSSLYKVRKEIRFSLKLRRG